MLRIFLNYNFLVYFYSSLGKHQLKFKKKPKAQHFRTFGCPAVFKRFKVNKDGKTIDNKWTQQGLRGIFVGMPVTQQDGCSMYQKPRKLTYQWMPLLMNIESKSK